MLSGARGRCRGNDGSAEAASASAGAGVLQPIAALSGWAGSVRDTHYWARELRALGHEMRLMPAQYVKAYVKRNKNDAADAEAICEAVVRPSMRFVPVKTADQQAAVLLHRGRERLVRQRTMLVNALRAHLAEFGVIAPQGLRNVGQLIAIMRPRFADTIRASSRFRLREQAGHMTASDLYAARQKISCQAGPSTHETMLN